MNIISLRYLVITESLLFKTVIILTYLFSLFIDRYFVISLTHILQ